VNSRQKTALMWLAIAGSAIFAGVVIGLFITALFMVFSDLL
jgi:hypothetical protein